MKESDSNAKAMAGLWDSIVDGWLAGGPSWSASIEPWLSCYGGTGAHAVVPDALPEPWFGDLGRVPAMVFLALNPGQPFLGTEAWRDGTAMPDLQSRAGLFAQHIRAAGSYSAWAARFPDWSSLAPTPNTFFTSRLRFARDWCEASGLGLDDCFNAELYPWHSYRFSAGQFRPSPEAVALIDRFVLAPVASLGCPYVFAFGSAWARLLPVLGFEPIYELSTRAGETWPGAPKDRVVTVFARDGLRIVAEYHSGGAGPPRRDAVAPLRERLLPHLDST